ncbi:MAG: pitrilysin family protein [Candidatus Paceibacterota bacterium]|jgi:predicted Zn-dependent peptidase
MYKKIILENGLRIILVPKEDSFSTTVLVLVSAGSDYEVKEINGVSHFLEHLCFKGTKNRPTSLAISSELDHLGAVSNAFTGNEYTGYYAKALPQHSEKLLEIISDLYLNPIFDSKEIEKERGVIIEEINMYEDLPMQKVQELFAELLYKDQPAGRFIAGTKDIIKNIRREEILNYRGQHYLAETTTVVVSGKINENEIVDLIKNNFENIGRGGKEIKVPTKDIQEKPEILLIEKTLDQTHLVLGVRAYDIFDKRRFALELLSDVLGGGMSSRLFQKLREELGVCYYVHSSANNFIDHGYLAISSGVDNNRVEEVARVILEELNKLKNEAVGEKELQTAKNHLVGNLFLGLEGSDDLASFYGGQEILKEEILTPEEIAKNIQAVSDKDIIEVAKDIFQNNKLNLALIGPAQSQEKIEKILTF